MFSLDWLCGQAAFIYTFNKVHTTTYILTVKTNRSLHSRSRLVADPRFSQPSSLTE